MNLQQLPSVEKLLQSNSAKELQSRFGRPLTLKALRTVLDEVRNSHRNAAGQEIPGSGQILVQAEHLLKNWTTPSLRPVINASGVILHTNLGRAPLSRSAMQAMVEAAAGYSNLEFDLVKGKRGSRQVHAERLLTLITGAEAALVVNNNAAAVLLALSALASRKRVIVSRTQLIEIGGGFRIPEVLRRSGAKLIEVGSTNKVHLTDYEIALSEPAAMVLHAHASNFQMVGFTGEPVIREVVELSHRCGAVFVNDLGSGTFLNTEKYGLAHELTVQEALVDGTDLVCFSGDKLLGGPQAGIITGRADLIDRLKKHPLSRAVRADKLCLAALSATLVHYLKDEAEIEIPVWRMIAMEPNQLKKRAGSWAKRLGAGRVIPGRSTIGGGSLPNETLPTWLLALSINKPNQAMACLRSASPPVIARLEEDALLLDPRTVLPDQDETLLTCLSSVISG